MNFNSVNEILDFAIGKELASAAFYTHLADRAADPALRQALLALAQEEARHKLRFELEYDQFVQPEN
jgi:rubrerythrin